MSNEKNRKPLVILAGLVVAAAAGLTYATRDKWGEPVPVATAPAGQPTPETKTAEQPAPETKTAEQPAATPAEPPKAEEQQVAVAKPEEKVEEPAPAAPSAPAVQPEVALPSFDTVRVEPGGSAIIAGRAAPGAEITIKHNGQVIASGVANADGAFAITPDKPLPEGAGVLAIEMKDKASGKVTASEQTVAVAVKPADGSTPMVAVLTPDAPTKIVQTPGTAETKLPAMDTVNIDAVDYDDKGNMVFAGRGPAGSKVQLYMDNNPLAEGAIGPDGTWSIAPSGQIAVGAHTLRADEIGSDGGVKSRVEIPFFREDAAKVLASRAPAPAQPETTTENQTVTVKTPDGKATVTATAPVTVEVKPEEPAKPAEQSVATAQPAEPEPTTAVPVQPPSAPEQPAATAETPPEAQPQQAAPAAPAEQPAATAEAPAQPAAPAEQPAKPAEQQVAAAQPVPDAKIIIQPGNNLWKLSRRIYGKGMMYTVIYEANKEYIRNPNLIYPGQIFVTPRATANSGG